MSPMRTPTNQERRDQAVSARPMRAPGASQRRAAATAADPRWGAVRARDPRADGTFVYAVATTGVYCRPSCGARPARPENVTFHASAADAERAGYRPCLRCEPEGPGPAARHARVVADVCRFLDQAEHVPSLAELAARAGLSPHHLHRTFKAATGLTPRAYAAGRRRARVSATLTGGGGTVTAALHDAGYGSSGRFYAEAPRVLGMTPTRLRRGAEEVAIHFAVGQCDLGAILVARSAVGVCAIALGDDPEALVRDLQDRFPRAALIGADPAFEVLVASVVGLVERPSIGVALPLDVRGTAFQRRVWEALTAIPPGATVTYAELAARVGAPASVRAVAGACAANTLAVAIPCHRVVRTDGSLSGYRWGVERKRALLTREAEAGAAAGGEAAPGGRAR